LPIENITVRITDMLGQKIDELLVTPGQQTLDINISRLKAGKYFVTYYNYGNRIVLSFIKK
jgi:hypothetical protein